MFPPTDTILLPIFVDFHVHLVPDTRDEKGTSTKFGQVGEESGRMVVFGGYYDGNSQRGIR